MIKFEKMRALTAENPYNLGAYQIIEIFLVLSIVYLIPRNQNKIIFYVYNYIDWDQFNQLQDLDWIKKDIQNTDAVARKLEPALTKKFSLRLEIAREEKQ